MEKGFKILHVLQNLDFLQDKMVFKMTVQGAKLRYCE